jgi:2,5-diketo-D-gluconate reductase A
MTDAPLHPPLVHLNDGREIPQLGLGVWQVADEVTAETVCGAIEAGYRHVDTAAIYGNERGVGEGIRASGVDRDAVWVTTKLWNDAQGGVDQVRAALEASLQRLGLDSVDLYLIHWPAPARDRYVDAWRAMVQLREEGLARSIGVSNFTAEHLERVIDATAVVPALNQVELHPWLPQHELHALHGQLGIATQGWSPLGQGGELLQDPTVAQVAAAIGATPAQVVLRWHLQRGLVTIPKSGNPDRIRENFDLFGFALDDAQMQAIGELDRGLLGRIGPDPAFANF